TLVRSCRARSRAARVFGGPDGRPNGRALRLAQRVAVEQLGSLRAGRLEEARERASPPRIPHPLRQRKIACEPHDGSAQRLRLTRRDEHPGLTVANELAETADLCCDHGSASL